METVDLLVCDMRQVSRVKHLWHELQRKRPIRQLDLVLLKSKHTASIMAKMQRDGYKPSQVMAAWVVMPARVVMEDPMSGLTLCPNDHIVEYDGFGECPQCEEYKKECDENDT